MKFAPKSEEQLREEGRGPLLPEGEYEFVVKAAKEKTSSKGNPMLELILDVYGPDGGTTTVFDYLLEAMGFKLRHFCAAADLVGEYEAGELTADHCRGVHARVEIKIDPPKNGYGQKNSVSDYLPLAIPKDQQRGQVLAATKPAAASPLGGDGTQITDDDIPF